MWALVCEILIDSLFWPIQGWGHCRGAIEEDEPPIRLRNARLPKVP
jgi:hypothetical protein